MCSAAYLRNKQNIYRYKEEHRERVREINRTCEKRRYRWKVIQTTFLRILLPSVM